MISALCALLALTQVPTSARVQEDLPNGARVLIERMEKADHVAFVLLVSSEAEPETPENHGMRHLLEHLVAGRADDRLIETAGGFLSAATTREGTLFELRLPPEEAGLGFNVIRDLLAPVSFSQEQIDREVGIIEQEMALRPSQSLLVNRLWNLAYAGLRPDPYGTVASMRALSAEQINAFHASHYRAGTLTLSIAGPVDVSAAREAAKTALDLPVSERPQGGVPAKFAPGSEGVLLETGSGIGARIPGLGNRKSVAVLAAGLALAEAHPGTGVTFTPSPIEGLLALTLTHAGVLSEMDAITAESLFERGRFLAGAWLRGQTRSPSASARLRAVLGARGEFNDPDVLSRQISEMTVAEFTDGLQAFRRPNRVEVLAQ